MQVTFKFLVYPQLGVLYSQYVWDSKVPKYLTVF